MPEIYNTTSVIIWNGDQRVHDTVPTPRSTHIYDRLGGLHTNGGIIITNTAVHTQRSMQMALCLEAERWSYNPASPYDHDDPLTADGHHSKGKRAC